MLPTLSRLAGRLVTGPIAFLVAGVVDVLAFGAGMLRAALANRPRSLRRRSARLRRRSARLRRRSARLRRRSARGGNGR